MQTKKSYLKPTLTTLGSVEEVTGWFQGGAGEFFGGNSAKVAKNKNRGGGPADFGS
jgi:hypothetical protein